MQREKDRDRDRELKIDDNLMISRAGAEGRWRQPEQELVMARHVTGSDPEKTR